MKIGIFAATMVAVSTLAFGPASAKMMGCSSQGLAKTEAAVEGSADGPQKVMMQKEIGQANTDLSNGNMRGCAMHMGRAEKMSMMKPAYPSGM
jgi:hypothetical protein